MPSAERAATLKVLGLRALYEADAGTRTPDPFITSEVLYQLSYVGAVRDASAGGAREVLALRASASPGGAQPLGPMTYIPNLPIASISDSPCCSQNAGPTPRISISSSTFFGRLRNTSSSTAFAATI